MNSSKIFFIPEPPVSPKTGGEIYNKKVFEYLSNKYNIVGFSIENNKYINNNLCNALLNFIFAGYRNILYTIKFKNVKDNIIIEDGYYSFDLLLLNWLHSSHESTIIPIVHHLYYPLYKGKMSYVFKMIESIFLINSDFVITNSEWTKRDILVLNKRARIVVVNPGPNIAPIKKIYKKYDGNKITLLSVGSLTRR